ncbi:F-box only 7, partial [Solea senegalensis]
TVVRKTRFPVADVLCLHRNSSDESHGSVGFISLIHHYEAADPDQPNTLLSGHGLSEDTQFRLSLNGSEFLSDSGETLSSCGIVSGDLICVVLPKSATAAANAAATATATATVSTLTPPISHRENQATPTKPTTPTTALTESEVAMETPDAAAETSEDAADPGSSMCSWEPMLCSEVEDGQAPASLELLYVSAGITSPSDAIMVVGHLLMTETGFIPQARELKPGEMPDGWRSSGDSYRLHYTHPLCESSVAMVIGMCMGPVLVITATLKSNDSVASVRKLCVNPCSYVTDEWPGDSAAAAFKDLRKLTRVFKDQLSYPLIAAAREAMALPEAFGLAALPTELLLRIIRLLDVESVLGLSAVSRRLNAATADWTLWRHLCRRDFAGPVLDTSTGTNWKDLYKMLHIRRAERRRVSRRHLLPPPFLPHTRDIFIPTPLPLPLHPPLPGIIGGEYDLRPHLPPGLLPRPRYDPINPLLPRHRDAPPRGDVPRRLRTSRGRGADARRGFI